MKKILFSVFSIVAAVALVAGVTWSQFNDTEKSEDNTFAAGTLDLKTNDVDGVTHTFTMSNLRPGSWAQGGQLNLRNAGTVAGKLWFEITNVRDYENTCWEPEVNDVPLAYKDLTCGDEAGQGELSQYIRPSTVINAEPWGRRFVGLTGDVTLASTAGVHYDTLTNEGVVVIDPGETYPLMFEATWHPSFWTDHDNVVQSDSVMFDVVFHLEQQ